MLFSISILTIYGLAAFFYLYKRGLVPSIKGKVIAGIAILTALLIRGMNLSHQSQDYIIFLSQWIDYYKNHGGFLALGETVGNYNIPYLVFLALVSYVDSVPSLTLIKLFSILFDVVLAIGITQLLSVYVEEKHVQLIAFLTSLFLPTVIIDSSFWGQCDSIYVAFSILSLYFALEKRPWTSMILVAIAFAFKLQAIFILPIFALLWACGYFKWYHFLAFPAVYFVMMLPAIVMGKPVTDAMLMYFTQTDSIGSAYAYNGPSLLGIVGYAQTILAYLNREDIVPAVCKIATGFAFLVVLIVLLIQIGRRKKLGKKDILFTAVLLALIIPFLLPHMHERYFFLADILTFVLAFVSSKYIPVFLLTEGASLWCYGCYYRSVLTENVQPSFYGSFAMALAIALLIVIYISNRKREVSL